MEISGEALKKNEASEYQLQGGGTHPLSCILWGYYSNSLLITPIDYEYLHNHLHLHGY